MRVCEKHFRGDPRGTAAGEMRVRAPIMKLEEGAAYIANVCEMYRPAGYKQLAKPSSKWLLVAKA